MDQELKNQYPLTSGGSTTRLNKLWYSLLSTRPATREGQSGNCPPPRNFHKRMYLLGGATSYIIMSPRKYQAALLSTVSSNAETSAKYQLSAALWND